ncbi:MAG: helical backbone metal receptor [Nocardioides sp.]
MPSLTEGACGDLPGRLVGVTDWCTHPADLDQQWPHAVRGTKASISRPSSRARPDLVVANQEENRELDVRRLRGAGTAVWVTRIESVPEAIASMRRLLAEALA